MTKEQVLLVLSKFDEHQRRGVYYRPQINWTDTMNFALAIKADRFLTLDKKQSALAGSAGLTIDNCVFGVSPTVFILWSWS